MNKSTTIGSLTIGIQIIDVVAQSEMPLKFSDIQERTGITKSNLYKYLNTLTQMDLLYKDPRQGNYALGYKFLEYGNAAMQNDDFITRLTPYFKEISTLTNMTTLLVTWVNDGPVITNIFNTNYGLNIGAQIGTKLPLMSAGGKTFAAFMKSHSTMDWIEEETKNRADFNQNDLNNELATIRSTGVAFAFEPLVKHVSSWGLPIFNYKNDLVAAISIVGFTEDAPKTHKDEIIQQVQEIVNEMSAIYGYKG